MKHNKAKEVYEIIEWAKKHGTFLARMDVVKWSPKEREAFLLSSRIITQAPQKQALLEDVDNVYILALRRKAA